MTNKCITLRAQIHVDYTMQKVFRHPTSHRRGLRFESSADFSHSQQ